MPFVYYWPCVKIFKLSFFVCLFQEMDSFSLWQLLLPDFTRQYKKAGNTFQLHFWKPQNVQIPSISLLLLSPQQKEQNKGTYPRAFLTARQIIASYKKWNVPYEKMSVLAAPEVSGINCQAQAWLNLQGKLRDCPHLPWNHMRVEGSQLAL